MVSELLDAVSTRLSPASPSQDQHPFDTGNAKNDINPHNNNEYVPIMREKNHVYCG
jgi:hypothetical protein